MAGVVGACGAGEIPGESRGRDVDQAGEGGRGGSAAQNNPRTPGSGGNPGTVGTGGSGPGAGGAGGSRTGGTVGMGGTGGTTTPPAVTAAYLPARVRRLSNFEFDRTISTLFKTTSVAGKGLPGDSRQSDAFTRDVAKQIDPGYVRELRDIVEPLATEQAPKLVASGGCSASEGERCAEKIIASFGEQAYRRVLSDAEKKSLLDVFRVGAQGATFNEGIATVVAAVLQSPSFLFVSELGAGQAKDGTVKLAEHEIASALSYFLTGGPPDAELRTAAAAGKLSDAAEREKHARRLVTSSGGKQQLPQFVKEWLAIDKLEGTGKDKTVYPKYDELRPSMIKEADGFINEVLFTDDGSLTKLLTADYTVADGPLAQLYGLSGGGAKRLPFGSQPRRGILMQSGFLSVHAHSNESSPVKRGNAILSRVMCVVLPLPGELGVEIIPPLPDPKKTTRERFAIHSKDPKCAACHNIMDPVGFAFENLDGIGVLRTTENGQPVDSKAELAAADLSGAVRDGVGVIEKLAASEEVKRCFARYVFRFGAAQAGASYEDFFLASVWDKLPAGKKVDLKELMVAFAASDIFVTRRTP